jgi:hypothetical protein
MRAGLGTVPSRLALARFGLLDVLGARASAGPHAVVVVHLHVTAIRVERRRDERVLNHAAFRACSTHFSTATISESRASVSSTLPRAAVE